MSALNRFEQFMQEMVEGSVARLFRSPVQPAEIAKRLERAMESAQTISVRRVIVPSVYRAYLNPQDFAVFQPIRSELEREMAVYLNQLAQERGFTMIEAAQVMLAEDKDVPRRSIQVLAELGQQPAAAVAGQTQVMRKQGTSALGPQQSSNRAHLIQQLPDGEHIIPLASTQLSIGRGLNNDIVLEDTRVSRNHAQLRYRARRFWISDLGSTNGTFVNGEPVSEAGLKANDVISLGGLELIFKEQ